MAHVSALFSVARPLLLSPVLKEATDIMKRNEQVHTIMTRDPVTVHQGQKLSEVRKQMVDNGFHHMLVVSGKTLVGVISLTDLLRVSIGDPSLTDPRAFDAWLDHNVSYDDVMQRTPATVGAHDTIRSAVDILAEGRFHSLPVIEEGDLVGIVTTTDMLRYLKHLLNG